MPLDVVIEIRKPLSWFDMDVFVYFGRMTISVVSKLGLFSLHDLALSQNQGVAGP